MFFQYRNQFRKDIREYVCSAPEIDCNGNKKYVAIRAIRFARSLLNDIVSVTFFLTDSPEPSDPEFFPLNIGWEYTDRLGPDRPGACYTVGVSSMSGLEQAKIEFVFYTKQLINLSS
jgi:hypothetical protein